MHDVETCYVYDTGLVLDKIASNAADVCAANFFPVFSSITKKLVKSFRAIANGEFKQKVKNIIDRLGGTKFKSEENKSEVKKTKMDKKLGLEEESEKLTNFSSKSDDNLAAKDSWKISKTFFETFKSTFSIGLKKIGSFFKALKNCFVSFGDEIVKNLGEYSMFLVRNTSLMPVNAFIQSLPGFAQVNSIFSIVRLVFYIWRLMAFPFIIEMKQKKLSELKKDSEEYTKMKRDLEFEFYSYGRSLGTAIFAGISAVTNAVGVGGILQGVASAAFIGALLTGLVRKGAKFVKTTYSKIRGYFSKGEEQLDKLNKNIVHTEPDERAKVKLGYEWMKLKYKIYENISPKEEEEIWNIRSKTVNIEMIPKTGATTLNDFFTKKKEELKIKSQSLSFNNIFEDKEKN